MVQPTLKHSGIDHTAFNLQRTPCLTLPRKRSLDGASTECGCEHLIAAHYSYIDPRGWKVELAWLVDLYRTAHPHKRSPVSYRSSAGRRKNAGQRLTFYRWATQPTSSFLVFRVLLILRVLMCVCLFNPAFGCQRSIKHVYVCMYAVESLTTAGWWYRRHGAVDRSRGWSGRRRRNEIHDLDDQDYIHPTHLCMGL